MSHGAPDYGRFSDPPYAAVSETKALRGVIRRRILAFLLDSVLIGLVCGALWLACFGFTVVTLGLGAPVFALTPAVPVLYNCISVASPLSATPGQAMMGLVVRRDDDLGPPGALAALVWAIGFLVTMALGAVLLVVALFTEHKRTLHDIVSGLVVVRAQALTSLPGFWNMASGGPFDA
jgi:uncharacterized RDD family membrane protein YckC